jgi:cellulose synthase/poly-beta-1,6-N-acetylglucosamine synthase-like glycosyltransferase
MEFSSILDSYIYILAAMTVLYAAGMSVFAKGLKKSGCESPEHLSQVSIVICMHNEKPNAQRCLECLVDQDYPHSKLEIIIVNDRSTDNTAEIVGKFADRTAVRNATGEIILLTDADGRPPKNWVREIMACFSERVGMVIGYAPYSNYPPQSKFHYQLLALEYFTHAAVAAASAGLKYPLTCVGTNMAYRKEVFLQLDGFGKSKNIHSGDDDLFLQRVRDESDWQIKYQPHKKTHVFNRPPATFSQFFHQRLRYASKSFVYPRRVTTFLFMYYIYNLLLICLPIILWIDLTLLLPLCLILVLKSISEFFFISTAASFLNDRRYLYLYPVAFFLHIPYVLLFGLLGQFMRFEWAGRMSR